MLDDETLHMSPVVANCAMNRERQLSGSNSYSAELKFDVESWLQSQFEVRSINWLDVCCGSGIALVEAGRRFDSLNHGNRLSITGIDLAGHFLQHDLPNLELTKSSIESWHPELELDLITCVHGLHYIGDKLGVIQKMVNWLSPTGAFFANIDLANLQMSDGRAGGRVALNRLKEHGVEYDKDNRLIRCHGGQKFDSLPLKYCGADDQAGPNYTGQPAVNSYYEEE